MPSTNHFKFGASGISSATRGGFKVGVVGGAEYGPTSSTGFWNGVTPPVGGYTIYVDKASQGPSIHVANNDSQCIFKLKAMGATGTTIEDVLAWADGQSNMAVLSAELTLGDLPGAGPTTYTLGDQALGGVISYILQSGDPGYDANTQHGIVFAPQSTSVGKQWYNGSYGNVTLGTGYAIGNGTSNTNNIISYYGQTYTDYAAGYCRSLTNGGYSDWCLPSIGDLQAIYSTFYSIPLQQFTDSNLVTLIDWQGIYWSSSESESSPFYSARIHEFQNYNPGENAKNIPYPARAVRYF